MKPFVVKPFDMFENVYKSGRAVGEEDIRNDTMIWRYREEVFEVPLHKMPSLAALYNGYFYEIPIAELRAMAKGK